MNLPPTGTLANPVAEEEAVTLSEKLFYIQHLLNPSAAFPNSCITLEIKGKVDFERLEQAFIQVIRLNENLRTAYVFKKGKIMRLVHQSVPFSLKYVQSSGIEVDRQIHELTIPFDFSRPPLLHAFYIKMTNGGKFLYIDMPHINSDGVSMGILVKELADFYNDQYNRHDLKLQFSEFRKYHAAYLHSPQFALDELFWKQQVAQKTANPDLALNRSEVRSKHFAGHSCVSAFPAGMAEKIKYYLKGINLTKFQLLLSAWLLLLYRLTGSASNPVLVPVHNRNQAGFETILGLLTNAVMLTIPIDPAENSRSFLTRSQTTLLQVMEHQQYPCEKVHELLVAINPACRKLPLCETFFNYHQYDWDHHLGEASLTLYVPIINKEPLALSAAVSDTHNGMLLRLSSAAGIYKRTMLMRFAESYFTLLEQFINGNENGTVAGMLSALPLPA